LLVQISIWVFMINTTVTRKFIGSDVFCCVRAPLQTVGCGGVKAAVVVSAPQSSQPAAGANQEISGR
jgi:hypothetical protein